jgi:hypothetical protein
LALGDGKVYISLDMTGITPSVLSRPKPGAGLYVLLWTTLFFTTLQVSPNLPIFSSEPQQELGAFQRGTQT